MTALIVQSAVLGAFDGIGGLGLEPQPHRHEHIQAFGSFSMLGIGQLVLRSRVTISLSPLQRYRLWVARNGIQWEDFSCDANGDGFCNALSWALGLSANDSPWLHLPRATGV